MGNKVSACFYINKEILETAKQVGLNLSKISENALVEAVRRLSDPEPETSLRSRIGSEGRSRDSNPGARLHRPVGYQATPLWTIMCAFVMKLRERVSGS